MYSFFYVYVTVGFCHSVKGVLESDVCSQLSTGVVQGPVDEGCLLNK